MTILFMNQDGMIRQTGVNVENTFFPANWSSDDCMCAIGKESLYETLLSFL